MLKKLKTKITILTCTAILFGATTNLSLASEVEPVALQREVRLLSRGEIIAALDTALQAVETEEKSEPMVEAPANPYVVRGAISWSQANLAFPRYSTATVRDVETGAEFRIKRTFGSNHADVEPLTKEDTMAIYRIWGGFSWDRRAVVIIVDGTYEVLAASMNGMPHAGLDRYPVLTQVQNRSGGFGAGLNFDMVKGNGMDGHLCLHFDGSHTHGSGQVSGSHQEMVQVAARYIEVNFK